MNHDELFVKMALSAWNTHIQRMNKFLEDFSDEQLYTEVAPGKNRIIYLLGHLIAVHDNMLKLFSIGDRLYAHLDEIFLNSPDKATTTFADADKLRSYWKKLNDILSVKFNQMSTSDWFAKHAAISAEDFAKEPERNKLNVLINRTNHLAYHLGQLQLVKKS